MDGRGSYAPEACGAYAGIAPATAEMWLRALFRITEGFDLRRDAMVMALLVTRVQA